MPVSSRRWDGPNPPDSLGHTTPTNRHRLADVAERRGDIEAAREHLDAAGALFAQHGAKLYLDQVLAKKQFLKA